MLTSKRSDHVEGMLKLAHEYKRVFAESYKLLSGARHFGASTTACENSFSCLQLISSKSKLSMTHERKKKLYNNGVDSAGQLGKFVETFCYTIFLSAIFKNVCRYSTCNKEAYGSGFSE